MKVLYCISVMGHGRGGHFHSLYHISNEVSKYADVKIITIGPGKSEIISSSEHFLEHIHFTGTNLISFWKNLKLVLRTVKPNIIHSFDTNAHNLVTTFTSNRKSNFILNKCGGPNPTSFPVVDNLILFSKENLKWFTDKVQFANTSIYLIPNRVGYLNLQNKRKEKNEGDFTFVRIARIGKAYQKSLKDSINLFKVLGSKGILKIKLYLIGTVEDEYVFYELKELSKGLNIEFITDKEQTKEASKMLYLADAVIATGRGVMEAMSLGVPVLTPVSNKDMPVLITDDNFQNYFSTNFSERNYDLEDKQFNNIELIESIITNEDAYLKYSSFSLNAFKEHFDVCVGGHKYNEVYKNASVKKASTNVFLNFKHKLRTFYKFRSASKLI